MKVDNEEPPRDYTVTGKDRIDALLWLAISIILLASIPIGFLSGDGLAQSTEYLNNTWTWNPNHLLYEPLGASWQNLLSRLGFSRPLPDILKLLSITAGAITIGLFRYGVSARIARTRAYANLATTWVALSPIFTGLWISDEAQMVQMPFLALAAISTIKFRQSPKPVTALKIGAFVGFAALFYISNVLIAIATAVLLGLWRWRDAGTTEALSAVGYIALAGICVTIGGFGVAWLNVAPEGMGFIHWLTTYGGGQVSDAVVNSYGVGSLSEIPGATIRAVYGSLNLLTDIVPLVATLRDNLAWSIQDYLSIFVLAVCAAALAAVYMAALLHRKTKEVHASLLLIYAWLIGIIAFGIYWNNSDDQFYFQLALPLGALIANGGVASRRQQRYLWFATLVFVLWNGYQTLTHKILYPRHELITKISHSIEGSSLVIIPGQDELSQLMYFINLSFTERIDLTSIATSYGREEGLKILEDRIAEKMKKGGRVDLIEIFDIPAKQNPWKYMDGLQYDLTSIQNLMMTFPIECTSRQIGHFRVRSISQSGPCGADNLR